MIGDRQASRQARIPRVSPLNSRDREGSGLSDEPKDENPLLRITRETPLQQAEGRIAEFRDGWIEQGRPPNQPPTILKDEDWFGSEGPTMPAWISGWTAFELLHLQTEPYEWGPPIKRIAETIVDHWDGGGAGTNYKIAVLPPNHKLLEEFEPGSLAWFKALSLLLEVRGYRKIVGVEEFISDLYEWLGSSDHLRIRTNDLIENALSHHWSVEALSLPEAKQDPIWNFPKAMAWIATRDYMALARLPVFTHPNDPEEPVVEGGVWRYATKALGWLHSEIAFRHCNCGALEQAGAKAFKYCTCISVAWEELVHFNGGLSPDTPELVFNLQEDWISMTWPDGAERIRFLRRDILERWPARAVHPEIGQKAATSTAGAEAQCRQWLLAAFSADEEYKKTKEAFQSEALEEFSGRLSVRGFLRVWDSIAPSAGRSKPGRKS